MTAISLDWPERIISAAAKLQTVVCIEKCVCVYVVVCLCVYNYLPGYL